MSSSSLWRAKIDERALCNAGCVAQLRRIWSAWELREDRPISEWAEENRVISGATSARHGRYSLEMFPFQREPQDCLTEPDGVGGVNVWLWAAQMGKTEMMNNVIGYHMDWRPSPILVMYPTLPQAEAWSREKLSPMLRDSPRLAELIPPSKGRDAGNTILYKEFPGGWIGVIGSNVPTGLSQHSARLLIADEIDRMATEIPGEGDPLRLLFHRADAFPDAIRILASTPTESGSSRIQSWFDRSDQRHWFIPCPRCGELQTLDWPHVKIDTTSIALSCIECERCKSRWSEAERIESVIDPRSHWRALAAGKDGVRGWYLNGLFSTLPPSGKEYASRIHQVVVEFLQSKQDGPLALQVFTNTVMARTFQTDQERIDTDPIMGRCEQYDAEVPDGVLALVAGVDVQEDRIEYEVVGYGIDDESWGIEHGIVFGNTVKGGGWEEFAQRIARRYTRADGSSMTVGCWAIDSGFANDQVQRFCGRKDHPVFVVPVKGIGIPGSPVITIPRKRARGARVRVNLIGTDAAKWTVYGRLRIEEPGPGHCHFPVGRGYDESYFKQLVAERIKDTYFNGRRVKKFFCPQHARNEALDLRVYALAALYLWSPDLAALAKAREIERATPQPDRAKTPREKQVDSMLTRGGHVAATKALTRRTGWVTRW